MTATLPEVVDAATTVADRDALKQLATLQAEGPLVVTAYVRLGVEDRIRRRYRIAVRDAVRRVDPARRPELTHDQREGVRRDLERITSLLDAPSRLPHAPGLGVFACESLHLFAMVPLPRVAQTRVLIGDRLRVAEALAAVEGFGRILVALVDRTHARFFEVTAFDVTELPCLILPATRGGKYHSDRRDAPGWGERDFHNRIREERHRQAAAVAERLGAAAVDGAWQGLVLAGPERILADEQRFLPRALTRRLLGTVRLNPAAATAADVRQAALDCRAAWERSHEAEMVTELEAGVGTGWAVNGPRPTLRALARGQVRLLLLPDGQVGAGYRCHQSGRLVLARGECRGEGEPEPVPDLVSEVLEEAWRQRVEVEVISDPASREVVDGLGALLRFR